MQLQFIVFCLLGLASGHPLFGQQIRVKAKVVTAFTDRNTTKVIIESKEPLVSGRNIYVGPDNVQVTVDILLSSQGAYYYLGKVAGRIKIDEGSPVDTVPIRELKAPSILRLHLEEVYTFGQKQRAEVTAVQGHRAMIDRGTLHEVHERDIYRIYASSGQYKGLLEVRGLGDFQSSGILYNALEDFHRRALFARPGDRVIFAGQRKLFGLALIGGVRDRTDTILNDAREENFGGGLVWNTTARDGWGVEILFGGFSRQGRGQSFVGGYGSFNSKTDNRLAYYIAPIWLKKNFFFPFVVSPFTAAGLALFDGKHEYLESGYRGITPVNIQERKRITTVVPVLGAGIELFPARFFRPRFEVRWLGGPKITAAESTFYTESVFYSLGFFTAW